ncbi:hypothetical protein JOC86_000637 [Bacillus pakistanensis]|uniref:Uncharacterized protein n=1 Tax=Rossellomorea pakistanensis TaxID=992288 RepID=A0ABS2N8J3_9BACI|nr:hypothetical protein [Bacillus pakistanensis]MBM7584100.1 hypothetical protein [Bacillus pakistanensis]
MVKKKKVVDKVEQKKTDLEQEETPKDTIWEFFWKGSSLDREEMEDETNEEGKPKFRWI